MTKGPKLGAKPIKYTDDLCEQVGKIYQSLGQTLPAEALGLTRQQVKNIAARIGAKCDHGTQSPSAKAVRTAALLKADREKREAAARANAAKAAAARRGGPVPMERKPLRHEARPAKPQATATVDTSRARITVAPPKLDTRFQPDPGHVGEFSRLGIGRYHPEEV